MALTNTPKRLTIGRLLGLTTEPSYHGLEAAAQTYKQGALLRDDDAGHIVESTSPVDGTGVTKRTFGLAVADATGVTNSDVHLQAIIPDGVLIEATLSDATAGTHTLIQADQWKIYPLLKDATSGHWYLDANAVSAIGAVVVEFKDKLGTIDARVYAKVMRPAIGTAAAGSNVF